MGLGQLAADLLLDLGGKLENGELTRQELPQPLEPGPHIDLAQQALLLLDRERQARCEQVGQPARLARIDRRDLQLLGDLLALVDHPLKEPVDVMDERVELNASLDDVFVRLDPPDQVRLGLHQPHQPRSMLTLADDPSRPVREFEHLENQAHAHDRIQVVDPRRIRLRMKLADQPDHSLADHAIIDQANSAGPIHDERHDRLRKNHIGSQRQQGNLARLERLVVFPLGEHDELSRIAGLSTHAPRASTHRVARRALGIPRSAFSWRHGDFLKKLRPGRKMDK